MLKLEHITVSYAQLEAVKDVSLTVHPGQWWMVAGPNGAGKSTLVGAIAQSIPSKGRIELLGREIKSYKPSELARKVGMLSQRNQAGYAFTVEEVAALGRYAYQGFWGRGDGMGQKKIDEALEITGLTALRHRSMLTLSGGETQRVFLAQVLAQDPALLLLDEPANHLDLPYQKQLFQLVEKWLQQPGRAVISVVHDLSLAKRYGTHALLLQKGRCVAQGETQAVLTRKHLGQVYEMDVFSWMQEMLSQWQK